MGLWLVEAIDHVDYDEYDGFVVRADDEATARALAQAAAVTGQKDVFTDARTSTCESILDEGLAGIILASFKAG